MRYPLIQFDISQGTLLTDVPFISKAAKVRDHQWTALNGNNNCLFDDLAPVEAGCEPN